MLKHLIFTVKLLKVRYTLSISEEVPNKKILWDHEIFSKTFDGLQYLFFIFGLY